jgi:hypothetical protein
MKVDGIKELDSRIEKVFSCAIDYSSYYDEDEETERIEAESERNSISVKTVKNLRSWWFEEENKLLGDLQKAIVKFSKSEGCELDEIETIEAQFKSDIFCADFIMFLGMHLFGKTLSDEDVQFAERIEVNDVDPDELNPHIAKFLRSGLPARVTVQYFNSPAGAKVLMSTK